VPFEKRISAGLLAIRAKICETWRNGAARATFNTKGGSARPGPQPVTINAEIRCLDVRPLDPGRSQRQIGRCNRVFLLVNEAGAGFFGGSPPPL
jgi:hypothetical protein